MSTIGDENLETLLAKVAMSDRQAFRKLYDLTSAKLFGGLLRILKEHSLAEDALQETYIRIWNNAKSYRSDSSKPMTWMHSIARYRAIDMLRRRRRVIESVAVDDDGDNVDPAMYYFDKAQQSDSRGLLNCLSLLDKQQKDAIVMCYCEGYTHNELSQKLSKPLGTIKSWVRRGLQALKECLER